MNLFRLPLLFSCLLVWAQADGPYLTRQADDRWLARTVTDQPGALVAEQILSLGDTLIVPAVGQAPAFPVRIRGVDPVAPNEIPLAEDVSLFVVADTHGEYEILVEMLRAHQVVDARLQWNFGRNHVVVLGDVFDRGPNQVELLWLFYELQDQAAAAGGGLHLLLGNHEIITLLGDESDLHPRYRRTIELLSPSGYHHLWSEETLLGRWLRSRATVLKIGNYLCQHGGISRDIAERNLSIADLNRIVREAIRGTRPTSARMGSRQWLDLRPDATEADKELANAVMTRPGPLWYRGYFPWIKDYTLATQRDVDLISERYEVKAILVGHTIVPTITPLFGGKVMGVQVYPRRDKVSGATIFEALIIEQERFSRAKVDGSTEPIILSNGKSP